MAKKNAATKSSKPTMAKALASLAKLNGSALKKKYREVFGKATKSDNVVNLRAAIARKLAGGDPRDTIAPRELAPTPAQSPVRTRDPRLPPVGTWLERKHDGVVHKAKVLDDGFEYEGERHGSLSAIAKLITGQVWNGYLFWGLIKRPSKIAAGKTASHKVNA